MQSSKKRELNQEEAMSIIKNRLNIANDDINLLFENNNAFVFLCITSKEPDTYPDRLIVAVGKKNNKVGFSVDDENEALDAVK